MELLTRHSCDYNISERNDEKPRRNKSRRARSSRWYFGLNTKRLDILKNTNECRFVLIKTVNFIFCLKNAVINISLSERKKI